MNEILIGETWIGELSSSPWGVIPYNGQFTLDEKTWKEKLRPGANEGANVCRVLPLSCYGAASPEAVFQPFVYMGNGQWDLAHFNTHYFPIMKRAIAIAVEVGIKIIFELFDHCGLSAEVRHLNPWCNNIQGYDSFYYPCEFVWQWVNRCLDEFGNTVLWGLGNELTESLMIGSILPLFHARGLKPFSYGADLDIYGEEHHSSVMKKEALDVEAVWDENTKIQIFRPCHSACIWTNERVVKPVNWWAYHSILFSDDGWFPRPTGSQWTETIAYVLNNQNIDVPQFGQGGKARLMFEHCPEAPDSHLVIRAMVAVCETYGVMFENKGKFPPPEPPKPPDPPEPPVKPPFSWKGEWSNNKGKILLGIGIIVILTLIAIFARGC